MIFTMLILYSYCIVYIMITLFQTDKVVITNQSKRSLNELGEKTDDYISVDELYDLLLNVNIDNNVDTGIISLSSCGLSDDTFERLIDKLIDFIKKCKCKIVVDLSNNFLNYNSYADLHKLLYVNNVLNVNICGNSASLIEYTNKYPLHKENLYYLGVLYNFDENFNICYNDYCEKFINPIMCKTYELKLKYINKCINDMEMYEIVEVITNNKDNMLNNGDIIQISNKQNKYKPIVICDKFCSNLCHTLLCSFSEYVKINNKYKLLKKLQCDDKYILKIIDYLDSKYFIDISELNNI